MPMESVHQNGCRFHGISIVNDALQSLYTVQNAKDVVQCQRCGTVAQWFPAHGLIAHTVWA